MSEHKDEQDTDNTTGEQAEAPKPSAARQEPPLAALNQYVRDLSFENPNAPAIFNSRVQPEFSLGVTMGLRQLQDRVYELVMKLTAQNKLEGQTGFATEVEYAGVFAVGPMIAPQDVEPLLYIEGGKFLYPFARHIMAEVTRMGGFPPLLLQMIDFADLYRQHKAQAGTQSGAGTAPAAEDGKLI